MLHTLFTSTLKVLPWCLVRLAVSFEQYCPGLLSHCHSEQALFFPFCGRSRAERSEITPEVKNKNYPRLEWNVIILSVIVMTIHFCKVQEGNWSLSQEHCPLSSSPRGRSLMHSSSFLCLLFITNSLSWSLQVGTWAPAPSEQLPGWVTLGRAAGRGLWEGQEDKNGLTIQSKPEALPEPLTIVLWT